VTSSRIRADGVRDEIGHIAGIDGLRGIAVLWVALFHFTVLRPADATTQALLQAPGGALAAHGYLGVDLFFLVSGFLLAMPWFSHEAAGLARPSPARFYARRFWRIVPAYYVQLVVLFGVVLPLLHGATFWRSDLWVYLYNLVAHALFLHNTTPLSSGSMQVNGALWTLAVEAQFYAILPLAMPLVVRAPRLACAGCMAIAVAWRIAAQVDLAPLVSLEMQMGRPWGWPEPVVRYLLAHQLPSYLGHFALGILLGRAWLAGGLARVPAFTLDVAAACAIVALDLFLAAGRSVVGELAWAVPMLAVAVPLAAAARAGTWTSRLLSRGPLAFVGRVSYSMYLYHLPLLLLLAPILPARSLLALPAYLAAAITVAFVSWRYVEQPWLRGIPRVGRSAPRASADHEGGADGEDLQRGHAP